MVILARNKGLPPPDQDNMQLSWYEIRVGPRTASRTSAMHMRLASSSACASGTNAFSVATNVLLISVFPAQRVLHASS